MIKIQTKTGNLLHVKSGHIVHGCNAQGVMGSGVALGVKQTWPAAYTHYMNIHNNSGLELGRAYPVVVSNEIVVWNAITQNLYGTAVRMVDYEAVATCFETINHSIKTSQEYPVCVQMEVHIPLIGAARGGGNWEIIREIIEQTMDFPVTLWLPDATVTTR